MEKKNNTVKINKFLIIGIVFLFVLVVVRISYLGITNFDSGVNLKTFAESRDTVKKTLYAKRGSIYDVSGEVLAQNVNSYTVIAFLSSKRTTDESNPKHVVDKDYTALKLAPLINMTKEKIYELLDQDNLYQVELGPGGRGITETTKDEIETLDLPGISFIKSSKRYYNMGNFASYILGYAKKNDDGEIIGEMGIELKYNDVLKGKDGSTEYQKDAYGYQIPNTPANIQNPDSGADIYLTIDSNIQLKLETAIAEISSQYEMKWLTITFADAKTGAIVASASNPSFNPNTLEIDTYLTPLTQYAYEPGSTMKIFSFMAAMEAGVYNGEDTYESGTIKVGDVTIKDFNNVGWGVISYDQGFMNSSNVAATKLAQKMGKKTLKSFYEKLGFGSKTGIEMPNENSGKIDFTYDVELSNASFGQGILTTPIQNIQALTTIANNGVMLKPYIIDKIVDSDTGETIYKGEKEEIGSVASKETIDHLRYLMYKGTNEGITDAKYFKTSTVKTIGKSGTAQIASTSGGYLSGKYDYIRSFAGLFPYEDPKYIVYVSAKQLVGGFNKVGEKIRTIIEDIATYKNITDEDLNVTKEKVLVLTSYINKNVDTATEEIKSLGLVPIVIGDGNKIIKQYPVKGINVVKNDKIFLLTNSNTYRLANVISWSYVEIKNYCNFLNIKCKYNGYGYVTGVSLNSEEIINPNIQIEVTLEDIYKKKEELATESKE